jgi:hypothetical protein
MTVDVDELISRYSLPTRTVSVLLDQDLALEHAEAVKAASAARVAADNSNDRAVHQRADEALDRLLALEGRVEDASFDVTFRALPRKTYMGKVKAYPPTKQQARDGLEFDPEQFGPDLIASCAVEPALTREQAQTIWDTWDDAQVSKLFQAAYAANREIRPVPFGRGSTARANGSEPNSNTPPVEESPTPSS